MAQDNPYAKYVTGGAAPAPGPVLGPPLDPTKQAAEARAQNAEGRAQQDQQFQRDSEERRRREWEATHNPDGTEKPKVVTDGKPTEYQMKSNQFYGRMLNAEKQFRTVPEGSRDARTTPGQWFHDLAPGLDATFNSSDRVSADNAARNWIAASLRQESGAAISPAEYENQYRIFFPMPGDTAQQIKEKETARKQAMLGFKTSAGQLAADAEKQYQAEHGNVMPWDIGATAGDDTPPPADGTPPSGGGNAPIDLKPLPDANSVEKPVVGDMSGFQQVASGQMRNEPSPEDKATTDHINQMWLNGASMAEINGYLSAKGYPPSGAPTPEQAKYYRNHGGPFQINRFVPQSERQKAAAGPVGAYAAGAADSLTFGFSDELAGGANAALGGDYTQARDSFQGKKTAMAETHPLANVMGNISGALLSGPLLRGVGGALAPTTAARASGVIAANPVVASAGMGALYGAGSDNENRLRGAVLGGAFGGGLGAAGKYVVAPTANALAESRVGQAVANTFRRNAGEEVAGTVNPAELIAAGKQNNVRVMTSDAFPPKTAVGKTLRMIGENIPFIGTGGTRAAQQTERAAAVSRFAKEFEVEGGTVDGVTKNLLKTRGKQIETLTTAKNAVIESVPGTVQTSNTLAAIDNKIAELTARNTETSRELAGVLKGMRKDFEGKTLPQLEAMRVDELSSAFKAEGMARIRDLGEKTMRSLYTPLKEDMGAFIKANGKPGDFNKWSMANKKLSDMMGDLKSSKFKSTLNNGATTPEEARKLLFSQTPSDVQRLVKELSPKGQAKARSAVVSEALSKATDDASGMVSPEKFLTAINALKPSTEALFKGEHGERLDGLVKLLGGTRRAGQTNAEIPNGLQATRFGVAGGAVVNPKLGVPAGLLARAYESPVVRDLLVRLGRAKAGSTAEAATQNRLMDIITRLGAARAPEAANDTLGSILARSPGQAAADDETN